MPKNVSVPFGVTTPRKIPVFKEISIVCVAEGSPKTWQVPQNKTRNLLKAGRRVGILPAYGLQSERGIFWDK